MADRSERKLMLNRMAYGECLLCTEVAIYKIQSNIFIQALPDSCIYACSHCTEIFKTLHGDSIIVTEL